MNAYDCAPIDRIEICPEVLRVWTDSDEAVHEWLSFEFLQDGVSCVGDVVETWSGCASVLWTYPVGAAHTVTVRVWSAGLAYMVEPITLEVYRDTRLLFWVERDNSSKHTFHGKLVTTEGAVVAHQPIKAYLNDTEIQSGLETDDNGCFTFERNFNPTDQKVTYSVQVSFEGTGSLSAVLNATALDGSRYTVCQTTQFNYRPSANMTTIVVEPQATQVTAPAKTPEQIQQEATQEGFFKAWIDFSWWYPWLRMHVEIRVNPIQHIALNPLLVGGEIAEWSNDVIELLRDLVGEYLDEMILEVVGLLIAYLAAKALSVSGRFGQPWLLAAAIVIFAIKCGAQAYLFARSWSDKMGMLASALVSTVLALFALAKIDVVLGFIKKVATVVSKKVGLALSQLVDKLLSVFNVADKAFAFCRDIIDYLEIVADFCFAGASWVRYVTLCGGVP